MLGLDASLFASGDTSAAYLIWEYMRNFANIAMIIILVIIIFSQVTGVGIDNYGIKKMLPKLILVAVLINLSYVICQLAVDVSNILGQSIAGLGNGIKDSVLDTLRQNGTYSGTDFAEIGFAGLFTALFGIAAGAAVALPLVIEGVMLGAAFWWIPLAFVALIGLISLIIFFLLLAARKLLAVVCVAIAPLALVCYALPNTQKLFKKWLDAFKGLLVVYPICAAMYAVSKLMKAIAFSADGIHIGMIMVAMLFTFVPFLAAPALIRKSLSAFGEFGGFLDKIGNRMKSGVNEAHGLVKSSAVYKDALRNSENSRAMRRNERFERAKTRHAELSSMSSRNASQQREFNRLDRRVNSQFRQREYARNAQLIARNDAENVEATRLGMRGETGNYDTNIMGAQLKTMLDQIDSGQIDGSSVSVRNRVNALMSQLATQAGGAKQISNAAGEYDKSGNFHSRVGVSAQLIGQYMAQNDKVRSSLESKQRWNASRISDIASGAISASTTQEEYDQMNNKYLEYRRAQRAANAEIQDFAAWQAATGDTSTMTVAENIAQNVLDKDRDFVTQTGGAVSHYAQYLSQDRINKMASNSTLFGYGDIATGVQETIHNLSTVDQDAAAKAQTEMTEKMNNFENQWRTNAALMHRGGNNKSFYAAPSGWTPEGGDASSKIYVNPNNPNWKYDRSKNTFIRGNS